MKNQININYLYGPKVEILGDDDKTYFIEFKDKKGNTYHSDTIKNNMWTQCNIEYYVDWCIYINGKLYERLNIEGENVLISLDSKSWGDTLAWAPYVVEFQKKHNCNVFLSTFHNDWFIGNKHYENINFINPGTVVNCIKHLKIGWFKGEDGKWSKTNLNPNTVNLIPLQQTASDILGLEFKELNYGVKYKDESNFIGDKYVVIGTQSTSGCKEWDIKKWEELAKKLNEIGYKVVTSSKNPLYIKNTINDATDSFDRICTLLNHAEFFIGLSSGLSWLNWSLNKKTLMIAGFSEEWHEFKNNCFRIKPNTPCIKCWNDSEFMFDAGDWNWCPVYKGTNKQFICQKSISVDSVFEQCKKLLKKPNLKIVIGLPGSGKTYYSKQFKDSVIYDDWGKTKVNNLDIRFDDLINNLNLNNDIIINSIGFCDSVNLSEFKNLLEDKIRNYNVEEIYFENDLDTCINNIKVRSKLRGDKWVVDGNNNKLFIGEIYYEKPLYKEEIKNTKKISENYITKGKTIKVNKVDYSDL